jgi:chorismate synthase
MGSNSFGRYFTITTWGESHGKAIGVVIDGCPAQMVLSEEDINQELARRAPGNSPFTSTRKESDKCDILSGLFEGLTTGAPISIIIPNRDVDTKPYQKNQRILRPGHASFTYLEKYGHFDYRGGGRASARETACRVAAGAVAKKWLKQKGITVAAFLQSLGHVSAQENDQEIDQSSLFCADKKAEQQMIALVSKVKEKGDSVGGVVAFTVEGLPTGLGDPIYHKMEANLASALLSIPASKAFSIGEGFNAALLKGSEHNDPFQIKKDEITTATNHCGGVLAGITNGMPLWGHVAFKPTSSIKLPIPSVDIDENKEKTFQIPKEGRHDPCVAIRAVPVVSAMVAMTIMDFMLSPYYAN